MALEQGQEITFLNEQGIRVTNSRFILPKQTFAMSGITSVQFYEEKPKRLYPVFIIIVGTVTFLTGGNAQIIGGIIFMLGGIWLAMQKTIFHVLLHTSSGEAKALSSKDGSWISRVIHAINESMIHRG